MQLREAKPLGMLDHHNGRVRGIYADLNYSRGDKNIKLSAFKLLRDRLFFLRFHTAMQQADARPEYGRELAVAILGGGKINKFRLFDQRTHPIGSPAGFNRAAHAVDQIVNPCER